MTRQRRTDAYSLGSLFCVLLAIVGCSSKEQHSQAHPTAPELMIRYGCPTCHVIPGVPGAVGKVGPSLSTLSQRSYLAGSLPNTPSDLEAWLKHPQSIRPGSAMPEMNVTDADAQRMALFLDSN